MALAILSAVAPSFALPRPGADPARPASRLQPVRHLLRHRQARGQPRALDAEQLHQAGQAVLRRAVDEEIGGGLAGAGELGPDAGIVGRQGAVGQARPVAADRGVEAVGPVGATR